MDTVRSAAQPLSIHENPQGMPGFGQTRHFFPSCGTSGFCYADRAMKTLEAYNYFLSYGHGERNYARETLIKLQDCFRCWLLPVLGDLEVGNVTRMDVLKI